MCIFLEPVNLRQWNLFDNVKGSGHVECFLATRDMQLGDIVILHVGKQDPAHESVELWANGLPRKILGYRTPDEAFEAEMDRIFAV